VRGAGVIPAQHAGEGANPDHGVAERFERIEFNRAIGGNRLTAKDVRALAAGKNAA